MLMDMSSDGYQIIFKHKRFLVVAKPAGLPTVPLAGQSDCPSLLGTVAPSYPEVTHPVGRYAHEGMVLHRLDTATCGLVLIARDVGYYRHMLHIQQEGSFYKEYHAVVGTAAPLNGFPAQQPEGVLSGHAVTVSSLFRPFGDRGHAVRPVTENSSDFAKKKAGNIWYATVMTLCGENERGMPIVRCRLNRGFRHQVRAHLAWSGYPIIGDELYGGEPANQLHLAATALTCMDPDTDQLITIRWADLPAWAAVHKEREDIYEQ